MRSAPDSAPVGFVRMSFARTPTSSLERTTPASSLDETSAASRVRPNAAPAGFAPDPAARTPTSGLEEATATSTLSLDEACAASRVRLEPTLPAEDLAPPPGTPRGAQPPSRKVQKLVGSGAKLFYNTLLDGGQTTI